MLMNLKKKQLDVLTKNYDIIARFQGGPNAGHTLIFDGHKHVLHTIPSGIFHKTALNIVGNGVVIDPVIFKKELENLDKHQYLLKTFHPFQFIYNHSCFGFNAISLHLPSHEKIYLLASIIFRNYV